MHIPVTVTEKNNLRLHDRFSYRVEYVGNEKQPVIIVDNYLHNAEVLINYCEKNLSFVSAGSFYPGVRMPVPALYGKAMFRYLGELIFKVFSVRAQDIRSGRSLYSMVITPPSELKVAQRLPHCDSADMSDLACVHYLCDSHHGGTSLYRHKSTGYEYINQARKDNYVQTLERDLAATDAPMTYMNGSNDFFEQIASYEAKFNRMVMYRSTSLHSGNIPPDFKFDPNPRTGRLTLNTFINCQQSS